jgi:hypothetical protein
MQLNKNMVGLALGALMGSFHLVWGLLVAFGWAQAVLDFIFNIHMLSNPVVVNSFSVGLTVALVIVTFVVGYILGWVFAWFSNMIHKR